MSGQTSNKTATRGGFQRRIVQLLPVCLGLLLMGLGWALCSVEQAASWQAERFGSAETLAAADGTFAGSHHSTPSSAQWIVAACVSIVIVAIAACVCVSLFALRAVNELRNAVQRGNDAGAVDAETRFTTLVTSDSDCGAKPEFKSTQLPAGAASNDQGDHPCDPRGHARSCHDGTLHVPTEKSNHAPFLIPTADSVPARTACGDAERSCVDGGALVLAESSEVRLRTTGREVTHSPDRYELAVRGSSDGIWDWNTETDEWLRQERNRGAYVIVSDARTIPEVGKLIEAELWLNGHGYFDISKSEIGRAHV
mgnify:CR=1 FL=1